MKSPLLLAFLSFHPLPPLSWLTFAALHSTKNAEHLYFLIFYRLLSCLFQKICFSFAMLKDNNVFLSGIPLTSSLEGACWYTTVFGSPQIVLTGVCLPCCLPVTPEKESKGYSCIQVRSQHCSVLLRPGRESKKIYQVISCCDFLGPQLRC